MLSDENGRHLIGQDLIDLPELVRALGRYKWGILAVTLLVMAGAALYAYSLRPVYRGTVSILIEPKNQSLIQGQDVYDPGTGTNEYFLTQTLILKSRDIVGRVVERLRLTEHQEFNAPPSKSLFQQLNLDRFIPSQLSEKSDKKEVDLEALKRDAVIQAVVNSITVEPLYRTQIVLVHFNSYSPELSAQVANALADVYIESGLQAKLDATRRATQWLTEKLSDIKAQLEKSEASLQAFKENAQIVTVGSVRGLTESEVADYAQRLREAQRKTTELASAYEKVRKVGADPRRLREVSAVIINPLVQKASESMLSAQEAIKQIQERYGDKHPQMATAKARLETATAAFDEQLRVAAEGLRAEYEIALQNERSLERQVEISTEKTRKLDRQDYQLSILQREVATNREIYDSFLTRFKQADAGSSFEALNARIVDPAVVPKTAYEPNVKRMLFIAGIAGLLIGLLLTLLRHLLSEEIHSAEELEQLTRLPVLSVLPAVPGIAKEGRQKMQHLYLEEKDYPSYAEGIRSVRTALKLSDADHRFKRLMVTSSVPKEGKSSVSSALSFALGAGERVLLVDADLRMPVQHNLLKLPAGSKGLSDALVLDADLEQCFYKHEEGGIWIMPAGTACPKPSELLSSEAFGVLVAELSTRFDRIVFDTPPCLVASDVAILSKYVDAALFVVKSDSTSRRSIKNAIKSLNYAKVSILGHVVNQVDIKRNQDYLSGYYYAYGSYGAYGSK